MIKIIKWLIGIVFIFALLVIFNAMFLSGDVTTEEIAEEAIALCEERKNSIPSTEFTTDACTFWPDTRKTTRCCIEHDMKYWCGGSFNSRKEADDELRECLQNEGVDLTADILYYTSRAMGESSFPFDWRWGYGYEWGKYR